MGSDKTEIRFLPLNQKTGQRRQQQDGAEHIDQKHEGQQNAHVRLKLEG